MPGSGLEVGVGVAELVEVVVSVGFPVPGVAAGVPAGEEVPVVRAAGLPPGAPRPVDWVPVSGASSLCAILVSEFSFATAFFHARSNASSAAFRSAVIFRSWASASSTRFDAAEVSPLASEAAAICLRASANSFSAASNSVFFGAFFSHAAAAALRMRTASPTVTALAARLRTAEAAAAASAATSSGVLPESVPMLVPVVWIAVASASPCAGAVGFASGSGIDLMLLRSLSSLAMAPLSLMGAGS